MRNMKSLLLVVVILIVISPLTLSQDFDTGIGGSKEKDINKRSNEEINTDWPSLPTQDDNKIIIKNAEGISYDGKRLLIKHADSITNENSVLVKVDNFQLAPGIF